MIRMMFVILVVSVFLCVANAEELPSCLMEPEYVSIPFPEKGLIKTKLPGEDVDEKCESIPAGSWTIKPSNQAFLFVNAAGPAGSGHYWKITVGIGEEKINGYFRRAKTH